MNGGESYSGPRLRRQLLDLNEYHAETDSCPHIDRDTMNDALFDDPSFHLVQFALPRRIYVVFCRLFTTIHHTHRYPLFDHNLFSFYNDSKAVPCPLILDVSMYIDV